MQSKETRLGPHHFSAPELKKVGVRIVERHTTILLECEACGCMWSPDTKTGGGFPRNYWKCPEHGCNAKASGCPAEHHS